MNLDKEVFELSMDDILPNRFQPREVFDKQALNELALSIREHGVIQPIIVRKIGDKYEIVAGERRFRASQIAGKTTIPALVRNIDDRESAKVALLENLQRKNLTSIEEARTYDTILKLDNMTQEQLANNLGKSQSAVANKLRLLNLDPEVQDALLNEKISERHARSLLNVADHEKQKQLLNKIIMNRMTVKQLDDEIGLITGKKINTLDEVTKEVISPIPVTEDAIDNLIKNPEISEAITADLNNNQENNSIVSPIISTELDNNLTNNLTEELPEKDPINSSFNENIFFENPQPTNKSNLTIDQILASYNLNLNNSPKETQILSDVSPTVPNVESTNDMNKLIENIELINDEKENSDVIPNSNTIQPIIDNDFTEKKQLETVDIPLNNSNYQINQNEVYDLRFAINNFRQAVQNTEKFGFKVTTEEFDFDNLYQIVIKIDKNKNN